MVLRIQNAFETQDTVMANPITMLNMPITFMIERFDFLRARVTVAPFFLSA